MSEVVIESGPAIVIEGTPGDKGDQGPKGDPGISVTGVNVTAENELLVDFSDATQQSAGFVSVESAGGLVPGQIVLELKSNPLAQDFLRMNGGKHLKTAYPAIADSFPTASDWGLGGGLDNTSPAADANLWALALSNDGTKLYTAPDGLGVVNVYDTATWALITSITIDNGWTATFEPTQMILSEDGTKLVLGVNTDGDSGISVIDTETNAVITHIADSVNIRSEIYLTLFAINHAGNKVAFRSKASSTTLKVYNIDTGLIDLSFDVGYNLAAVGFKTDNDYLIVGRVNPANNNCDFAIHNTEGVREIGPVSAPYFPNIRTTRKSPDYFYVGAQEQIQKISTSDLSVLGAYFANGRSSISVSGNGDYLAIGSEDAAKGYFFVLREETMSLVADFPAAPSRVWGVSFAKNDTKVAFAYEQSPYFSVANQLGSVDEFTLTELTAPDLNFEYRIKAK